MGITLAEASRYPYVEWVPYKQNLCYFGIAWGLYFMWVHLKVWEWLAIILVLVIELGW